jgi:hypothetical protein
MAQTFDTGHPKPLRAMLVGALASRFADIMRPAGYVVSVVVLPRQIGAGDEEALGDLARAAQGRAPCIAIAVSGKKMRPVGLDATEAAADLEFSIYAVSDHARGIVDGRLYQDAAAADSKADPGIFALLEHIEERVHGAFLGVDGIDEPRQHDEDELATFDDVTVWVQRYRVNVERRINPDRAVTAPLLSIQAEHMGDAIPNGGALSPFVTTVSTLEAP